MPFNEADFYRVSVRHVESHEREGVPQGIVLLARDDAAGAAGNTLEFF